MSYQPEPLLGQRFKKNNFVCQNFFMDPVALESKKRIEDKVKEGLYQFESCDCFCQSSQQELLAEIDRCGNYYPVVICKECGLIRANHRWTKKSYADFYAHEYRTLYGDIGLDLEQLYEERIR